VLSRLPFVFGLALNGVVFLVLPCVLPLFHYFDFLPDLRNCTRCLLPPIFPALIRFCCSDSVLSVLLPMLGSSICVRPGFLLISLWRPRHRFPAAQELRLGPARPGATRARPGSMLQSRLNPAPVAALP
jgi:hypothetical protein